MRNAITFLAAVLAVMLVGVMPSKAQDTGDMIYVYQKNGDILPFVRSEIMEFCYSFEDEDSVTHEEPVMQCIVMEDSIVRIPIENIDSVSFVTPATVYQPGVIRIEQGLMDYVESCDDETSTIRLSAGTPSAIVPKVGDKLVTLEMNEKFEGGFAGVVSKVSTDADGITIQCEDVELEDIFETYYNTVVAKSEVEEENNQARRYVKSNDTEFTWQMPTISYVIGAEYTKEVKKIDDLVWKVGTKGEVSITPTIKLKNSIIVSKNKGKQYIGYINGNFELKETMSFYGGLEWSKDIGLKVFKKAVAPLCYFYIKPGVFVKAALTASINAGWTQVFNTTFHYDYNNKRSDQPLKTRVESKKPTNEFGVEAMIDGSISAGMFVEIGVCALTEKYDNISWRGELGAELVGHLVLYNNDIKEASNETRLYEVMKSSGIECNLAYSGTIQAKLGKEQWNFPVGLAASTPIDKWDLVPTFDKMEFTQCYSPLTSADASSSLTGKCIMPLTVGLVVKDDKGQTVDNWNAPNQYKNGGASISTRFTGLKEDANYTVQPKLVFFDFDILANPTVGITKNPFPVRIVSFEQTGSHYSKQKGFEYDGRNYFYKFNATTTVELSEGVENVKDWGYVYVDFYGEHKKISCANMGTHTYPDVRYAYYYNGPQRTVELYPYVQFEGDSEIQGGKHKIYDVSYDHEATTSCPDGNHPHMIDLGLPSGTLWSCCNVGATEPEDGGNIYEWGCTTPYPQSWYYNEVWNENSYNVGSSDFGYTVKETDSHYGWSNNQDDYSQYMVYDPDFLSALEDTTTTVSLDIAGTPYDAATTNWGEAWQTPTKEQMQELIDYCVMEPVIDGDPSNPVHFKFSNNGRYILLPSIGGGHEISTATITANQYEWSPLPVGSTVTRTEDHKYYGGYMTSTEVGKEEHPWFLYLRYIYKKRQAIRAEGVTQDPVDEKTTQKLSDGYQETAVRPVMRKR